MIKELKYLFYVIISFGFIFLNLNYYFSDENKKKTFNSINLIEKKTKKYSENLTLLKSDTENVIIYVEKIIDKDKKKYLFWKLLENNE